MTWRKKMRKATKSSLALLAEVAGEKVLVSIIRGYLVRFNIGAAQVYPWL